jgi:hypothetical protein
MSIGRGGGRDQRELWPRVLGSPERPNLSTKRTTRPRFAPEAGWTAAFLVLGLLGTTKSLGEVDPMAGTELLEASGGLHTATMPVPVRRCSPVTTSKRLVLRTCHCGQQLDLCPRQHCPRCGRTIRST